MHIELKPFLSCFGIFFHDLLHHSAKELIVLLGIKWAKFSGCRTENQNCLANTHEVRRCWTISSAWSQKGHRTGWGRPLCCSLSAVQQRFLIASHINVLHLLGAQDFHRRFHHPWFKRDRAHKEIEPAITNLFESLAARCIYFSFSEYLMCCLKKALC